VDEEFRGAGLAGDPEKGEEVIEVGMDTAVGNESDQVEALAGGGRDGFLQDTILGEGAIADCEVDAGEFLINDPTGAKVQVADLRISHLTLRESDLEAAGLETAPWVDLVKTIMDRGFGEEGSVALLLCTVPTGGINAPTIANEKKNWLGHLNRVAQRGEKSRVDLSQRWASVGMAKSWGLRFLRKKRRILK